MLNHWYGIGNLGRDPEVRYTPAGVAVANFSIATSETWKDKETGEKKEKTTWIRMVAFGRLAEIVGEYLTKGKQIFAAGPIQTREWEDNDGNKKYGWEVVMKEMKMLGGGKGGQERRYDGEDIDRHLPGGQGVTPLDDDDDIPF